MGGFTQSEWKWLSGFAFSLVKGEDNYTVKLGSSLFVVGKWHIQHFGYDQRAC